ncbi:MAG: hypothetical protein C4289_02795 [Chloroflexota bacterium]
MIAALVVLVVLVLLVPTASVVFASSHLPTAPRAMPRVLPRGGGETLVYLPLLASAAAIDTGMILWRC